MSTVNQLNRDCTERCKSKEHGNIICAALTKRAVSDEELCGFLNSLCSRCESVKDHIGRTALHIAASCGRLNVVKWLLHVKHANINIKDEESGYTALHRSIFYGKIDVAVYLLKQGANTTTTDSDGLTALAHLRMDHKQNFCIIEKSEVYAWGLNTNYVFGTQPARSVPELLDTFHKENRHVYIKQVCLEKFHCVLVTTNGQVYSCGHGYGGRLGQSSEEICMSPKLVKFTPRYKNDGEPFSCSAVSVNIDHSVFLSTSGHVWTCGLNTHYVLGITPPPAQMLKPYQLRFSKTHIIGIAAGRYHTVAWSSEQIYSWGLNSGQLGHSNFDKFIIAPKIVSCLFQPKTIAVTNAATAVLTVNQNIHVFYGNERVKINARLYSLQSISMSGGRFYYKVDNTIPEENNELKIVGLDKNGFLFIWQENNPEFMNRVSFVCRSLNIVQITFNINELLFVTKEGEAYHGTISDPKNKFLGDNFQTQMKKPGKLESNKYCTIKVVKIPNVHRAISIASDSDGKNFAVLQTCPSALLEVPYLSPSQMNEDMVQLYESVGNESTDSVTFKIANRLFCVHRYIVATGSSKLYEMINKHPNQIIELSKARPDDFEQLLTFLYTGGYDPVHTSRLLKKANVLGLEEVTQDQVTKKERCSKFKNFCYTSFPELHDVVLKSKEGKLLPGHRCILTARSDYFSNCFSMRWNENSATTLEIHLPFSYNTLIMVLEYLYTDELPSLPVVDLDQVCNLLVVADHMCIPRLKEICERALCDFVTLKNVGAILSFAANYYAESLKLYCEKFMFYNLANILENRILEYLNEDLLQEVTKYFSNFYPFNHRIITPYSNAPPDEEVILASKMHPIVFEDCDTESTIITPPKLQKRRSKQRKSSSSEGIQQVIDNTSNDIHKRTEMTSPPLDSPMPRQHLSDNIPSRIKAIILASDIINCDTVSEEFIKLNSSDTEISFVDFPSLNNNCDNIKHLKSPKSVEKSEVKHKITKVSQKERKRLSSLAENNVPELPESPKNPWKVIPDINSPEKSVEVHSIIVEEKRQKENFTKMKFKHLVHIQIEDKAIEDLHKFYNTDNVFDEMITIRRVKVGGVAIPQWAHTNKKK